MLCAPGTLEEELQFHTSVTPSYIRNMNMQRASLVPPGYLKMIILEFYEK